MAYDLVEESSAGAAGAVIMSEQPYLSIWSRFIGAIKPKTLRSMRQFAEEEIILPDGPFEGERFACARQPFTALFFAAVEDPYWSQFVLIGPRQSSKTLIGFVVVICYYLFEVGEDVILAAPTQEIAATKWLKNIRPIIEKSRYAEYLPKHGQGSEEGSSNMRSIRFGNGAWLYFKSAGGGKGRSKGLEGDTARVICITEVEAFTAGPAATGKKKNQTDPDPLGKLRKSTAAFARHGRPLIFMECTTTTKQGVTWSLFSNGSASRLAILCPHCGAYVTPERPNLVGWQDAQDVLEARDKAAIVCPSCGALWSEEDRVKANQTPLLVHKGQTVEDGAVVGPKPRTDTLGFRWSAVNNLLTTTGEIGKEEWNAPRAEDPDGAEMQLLQYIWAKPYEPEAENLTTIDYKTVLARTDARFPRGLVPADSFCLTMGVDVGLHLLRWVVIASRPHAAPHVLDYGTGQVAKDLLAGPEAVQIALKELRDQIAAPGFEVEGTGGKRVPVQMAFVDRGYLPEAVYGFCDACRGVFFPSEGFGASRLKFGRQMEKMPEGGTAALGEQYRVVPRPLGSGMMAGVSGGKLVQINVDFWKRRLHQGLQTMLGKPGAVTLFKGEDGVRDTHWDFARSMASERETVQYVAGKGMVPKWVVVNSNLNHWFDAFVYALVAAHALGARLMGSEVLTLPAVTPVAAARPEIRREQGQDERSGWTRGAGSGWVR